jgi:hypothetical protein
MTLTLSPGWPWLASHNTLRVRMAMKPAVRDIRSIEKRAHKWQEDSRQAAERELLMINGR